jgi:hypothetical protein
VTALTPQQKECQRFARSRAGQIREGMRNYIQTLSVIHAAWVEEDWKTLGYSTWAAYVDGEFGAERVQLPVEHRRKAVEELRLAGMSTRALADTLGVDRNTIKRDLREVGASHPPEEVRGADGKTYRPARSPLVEAMTGAIEDAGQRAQDHRDSSSPGEADGAANTSAAGAGACDPAPAPNSSTPDGGEVGAPAGTGAPSLGFSDPTAAASPASGAAAPDPGVAAPAEEADIPASSSVSSDPDPDPAAGEGEQGGPATSPAGPPCEKCGTEIEEEFERLGYVRCESCDPDGEHVADENGRCRVCGALEDVPQAYLSLEIVEGVHGLYLRCARCSSLVSHLKAGMPLGIALVEAHLHDDACQ